MNFSSLSTCQKGETNSLKPQKVQHWLAGSIVDTTQ